MTTQTIPSERIPAIVVANHIIQWHLARNLSITPLRVIKLTYISNGFYLALFERSIFSESVQAWKYGTMIPSLYRAFGHYGYESIKEPFLFAEIVEHKTVIEVLDKTCDEFKHWTDHQLSAYCQEPYWSCSYSYSLENNIPNEFIMDFFKSKLKNINRHL
jgi:uncharacterized phage-associated protein